MAHNPLFEQLVDEDEGSIAGYVAYGIYKNAKREWIVAFEAEHNRQPAAEELKAYYSTWTPQQIANARNTAESALAEFAAEAIDEARPQILSEALKGGAVRSVLLSMLSALLYTLVLVVFVIVLKAAGIDVLSVAQTVG